MTIEVKQNLLAKSKYSLKAPYEMEAEFITLHNTANDATSQGEINYMIGNDSSTGFHYAVDEKEVVQGIPVTRNAYHCGDGKNGTGNRKSIGVEICYSKSGGTKYKKAEELAIRFVAQLLHERGWGIDRVKPHYHWSGKNCPHRIRDEGRWSKVIDSIEKELKALNGGKTTSSAPATTKGYLDKGDKGTAIKELQILLEKAGYEVGEIDGIFGNATDKAVRALQKDNKLAVDGIVGNATMQVLEALTAPKQTTVKKTSSTKKEELGTDVYGTVKVLVERLNVREKADFSSKIVDEYKKGKTAKVYGQKNGLYHLGGNKYCTANKKYITFTKNPNYGKVHKTKVLTVKVSELYTYKTANWDDKGLIVKKGEVFTIAKELNVAGSKMYQLKSGLFISANPKYVSVKEK
ncbi:peptidoglycan-binding protein [Peribacillus asahii]|uniref:peptidoglycan-binding protein n=1 Tax=Peribacillus asahii TaxID=228899 RepID=UPI00380D43E8